MRLADFVPTHPTPMPRSWCELGRGPCTGECYGTECALRLGTAHATTEPGELAPEREQRWIPGAQIVLLLFVLLAVAAAIFEWRVQ